MGLLQKRFERNSVLARLVRDDSGATAIEYGLIAALIAVAAIVAMKAVGTSLISVFTKVATKLYPTAPTTATKPGQLSSIRRYRSSSFRQRAVPTASSRSWKVARSGSTRVVWPSSFSARRTRCAARIAARWVCDG